jgi:hypothetical protein
MSQRQVKMRLEGHTSLLLDSGPFLILPALHKLKALSAEPEPGADPDRVTIKGFTRVRPLEATVIGSTLHVTLPIPDFERLGQDLRGKAVDFTELSFVVDDAGNASELSLDDRRLARGSKSSYIDQLGGPGAPQDRTG